MTFLEESKLLQNVIRLPLTNSIATDCHATGMTSFYVGTLITSRSLMESAYHLSFFLFFLLLIYKKPSIKV